MLGLDDGASSDEVLAAVRALRAMDDDDDDDDDDEGEDDGAQSDDDCAQDDTGDGADDDGGTAAGAMLAGAADPARYVAVAQFQRVLGELNQLRVERASERAERAVDDAIRAGKLIPAQRQWAISYCRADHKGFAAFAACQPAAFGAGFESAQAVFSGPAPAAAPAAALTAVETAVCAQLGLSAGDYLRRKRSGRGDFLRLNRGND
jgi:phage I-like protein